MATSADVPALIALVNTLATEPNVLVIDPIDPAAGCHRQQLQVTMNNAVAFALYRKCGFTVEGVLMMRP